MIRVTRCPNGGLAACKYLGGSAQVFDATVRAGSDEDLINLDICKPRARLDLHVFERSDDMALAFGIIERRGIGHLSVDRCTIFRTGAPVTIGASLDASSLISRSKTAFSELGKVRQYATASSQRSPFGARSALARCSNVTSSGAIIPIRAPASIDMLQTVKRLSIDMARMVEPAYSTA